MASVMSPPRGNKQNSRNAFHDLAGDDRGHKGRSADDGGSPGRNKVPAEFDGIGYPRDEDGARGGRKIDDRDRDRGASRSRGDGGNEDDKRRGGSRRRDDRDHDNRDDDGGNSRRGGDHDR